MQEFTAQKSVKFKVPLEKRKEQGLQVEKFSNTHIVGSVNITDDSKYMMTSIPYSEGWKVK